ncbi:MAG TPA: primosomal protein N' [Gammaproteobacteria bacterium]|jgi:primosomal protein N' (replication factor Y)|nr:primosomal protein N' [Gammaproteobacteria bacterium]
MKILRIALPTPLRRLFDYLPAVDMDTASLQKGVRVRVPFASRTLTGIFIEVSDQSTIAMEKLKCAEAVLDDTPIIPDDVYELCEWAAGYYHYSLGEVLSSALPAALRKGKPLESKKKLPEAETKLQQPLTLNSGQQQALDEILNAQNQFKVFLLDGVTGSGKTEVYLHAIDAMLAAGKQTLVLVPEISLTPQTIARFRARFPVPIAALHSSLSDGERLTAWLAAKSGEARIVIGTRSAIFTPFQNLGLMIVDEEHDLSFKQQDRFRYHARDMAVMRANKNNIPIVLGSATPSLESLLNAERSRYHLLSLPERAGGAVMPEFKVIDVRSQKMAEGLSDSLISAMREQLKAGNQVMLFLNRRGFAPVFMCAQCGWIAGCKRCDARMVYHRAPKELRCHHCDARMKLPEKCLECDDTHVEAVGLGTQRVEEVLQQEFPDIPVIRVDRDTIKGKDALDELLTQIHQEHPSILLGTQMLAKGHHFPQVTLVGIIDADSGLFSADFRAAEQMGQLLMQVSGRAGRAEKSGKVMIQTRCPDHPHLQTLIHQGYASFARGLMNEREQFVLPPYSYFALLRAEAYSEKTAGGFLDQVKDLSAAFAGAVSIMGPVPAFMAKKKGLHCQHLLIKAGKRNSLQQFLHQLLLKLEQLPAKHSVKWVLDVDPVEGG